VGELRRAELRWYEAHGVGRVKKDTSASSTSLVRTISTRRTTSRRSTYLGKQRAPWLAVLDER
jgi:hypothetical protein